MSPGSSMPLFASNGRKSPCRSAMVSKLPKFSGRSSATTTSSSSTCSSQTTTNKDGKTPQLGTHPNGAIHTPPFSLKWKKEEGTTLSCPATPTSPGSKDFVEKSPSHPSLLGKEVKHTSLSTPKMRRSGALMVAFSSPKAIPKQCTKVSLQSETKMIQNPKNSVPKMDHNGSNVPALSGSESHLVRPKLVSSSPRSSSQDSLSHPSDSIKTLALDNMVRSNSFTHFKQIPSPTSEPMTRSFSFNRTVELAKPLADTQLRPPRTSFLKPPQLTNGRMSLGLGGLNGNPGGAGDLVLELGGLKQSRTSQSSSCLPTPLIPQAPSTPSTLKKTLLPSCLLSKSVGNGGVSLGHRFFCLGPAKDHQALLSGQLTDARPSPAPECKGLSGITLDDEPTGEVEKPNSHSDNDRSSGEAGEQGLGRHYSGQPTGDALDPMSLSSTSSLDRGDNQSEFLDDFDSVGDALCDADMPDNRRTTAISQTHLQNFTNENMDLGSMRLSGHKEDTLSQESEEPLVVTSDQVNVPLGSSLELSPSNSSGGTYMWDEEGLEPLGGSGTHPCDSHDESELSCMDILNNLDPLGPEELDDNDLMLDVDLPEDSLRDLDGMSHIEPLERANRQGQRHKHRWKGPNHFYSGTRAPVFQHYDGLKAPRIPRPVSSENSQTGHKEMLDELTLKHMTQDCSSLKNQLLRLKMLLQLEDTDSPADVPEESEDGTTASQLEELITEVHMLREELRSRDKTIAQLTLQCQQLQQQEQIPSQGRQGRCQCNHQRAPASLRLGNRQTDKRMQQQYDKATQTYWRPPNHTPQILQPSSPCNSEHLRQGRRLKTPPIAALSDITLGSTVGGAYADSNCVLDGLTADAPGPADLSKQSYLFSTNIHHPGSAAPQGVPARAGPALPAQSDFRAPTVIPHNPATPRPVASTLPCILQPPLLQKHISVPALKQGVSGGSASLKPRCHFGLFRTKQLPPPSRGLPCFNAGHQMQIPSLCRTTEFQPHGASLSSCSNSSVDVSKEGTSKDPGQARILIPVGHSGLPKPKKP
ncbi:LOW QUALITY PROTEIN: serine-rich coiled-coil domain-containing protein 2 [Thalassophryne amazonica]|uniref:LOW QUALITY PROTEIN: serine-rich coiled-coil domain-containing protein 2 n=1 Tax=Thalassophryne amazonica TaxID=390379 RepID=UPI001470AF2B|nr:LOW QUALITY PROTEIN: serine-rich coiled-coil domain-containing protein 2 [Thalassophryne amazonica]